MIRSNTTSFITRFLVLIVSLALVGADLVVLGQNSNSSTTTMQSDNTSAGNMNMSGGRRRRRRSTRRRGRRRSMAMNSNAACGPMSDNTNMAGEAQENANTGETAGSMNMGGRRRRRGRRRGQAMTTATENANMTSEAMTATTQASDAGEQTDLSGTYSGNLTMTGGHEMSGPATITINGTQVTIEGEGMTHTGRVSAVTTRGYTGATFYFPDVQDTTTNTPLGVSVRARHSGSSLTLTPLAGAHNGISFTSGGGGMGGGRRPRGRRRRGGAMKMSGNACNPMAHAVTVQ